MKYRDVPGIDNAFLAMDSEEGVEVVWNEASFSSAKKFKGQGRNQEGPQTVGILAPSIRRIRGCIFRKNVLVKLLLFFQNLGYQQRFFAGIMHYKCHHTFNTLKAYSKNYIQLLVNIAIWNFWTL